MDDFQDTQPEAGAVPGRAESPQVLTIRFTGSGSEYFRIWIVNLLLTVVTLSLYHPWAKLRRLRYFHGNTLVDGHPLDFHGDPKKMLRGHLLVGAMLGLYTVANRASPGAALFAVIVLALLWPALMRASLQFRLANTSWRGMRLHFGGSLGGAYGTMLPLFLPVVLALVLPFVAVEGGSQQAPTAGFWLIMAALLASMVAMPWWLWRLKRYQLGHIEFGGQHGRLNLGVGAFYRLFFKWAGLSLLTGAAAAAVAFGSMALQSPGAGAGARERWVAIATIATLLMVYATVFLTSYPYYVSRMQNLVWNATATEAMQFASALRFRSMLALSVRNLLLMLLTLGLYWPFARVATARLRIEAVELHTRIDPDSLVSSRGLARPEATGDTAGDLFGIDFGL